MSKKNSLPYSSCSKIKACSRLGAQQRLFCHAQKGKASFWKMRDVKSEREKNGMKDNRKILKSKRR
jgi:hypothetical protein